jgi:hypothetical protein
MEIIPQNVIVVRWKGRTSRQRPGVPRARDRETQSPFSQSCWRLVHVSDGNVDEDFEGAHTFEREELPPSRHNKPPLTLLKNDSKFALSDRWRFGVRCESSMMSGRPGIIETKPGNQQAVLKTVKC